MEYPPECNSVPCKGNFVEQVKSRVSQSNNAIDLPLELTNGTAWNTNMTFCSFNQTEPGTNIFDIK